MELVTALSGANTLMPQAVALGGTVKDSTGMYFNPESCSSAVARDASGAITSVTLTDGVNNWVMTITRVGGAITARSKWVRQ